jgi:hypothetical protein
MIKGELLVRIKNTWPNEISDDHKKGFYRPVLVFPFDLFRESGTEQSGWRWK